ncbi:MAG: UbiA-like polyprenyltransferase [Terriglobales bacterium]
MSVLASSVASTRRTLEMIKFEHSVFALPFALLGALLAARGWPPWSVLAWIVVAMVAARSAAMTFNRIADRGVDAANPRTRGRALVTGSLSLGFAWGFLSVSAALFFVAAWRLNPLCLKLAPLALAWVLLYSYTKRFTLLSHWVLGVGLGIAPAAAWIAVRGSLAPRILLLSGAVALWVAGFDLLYACQDLDFDRSHPGLHSVPKAVGIAASLRLAQLCHLLMLALLVWLLLSSGLGSLAWLGLLVVTALLLWEHSLLSPEDLSRMNAAFFTLNGYIGILLLLFWGAAILVA